MAMSDADILAALYNNFDPRQPADETFYVDCTDVRGGDIFAEKLCRDLSRTSGFIHPLFTGHVGCGKSSELQHLANKLEEKCPPTGRKRFLPILVDTSEYLDRYDASMEDILLAIVSETGTVIESKTQVTFPSTFLEALSRMFENTMVSSIEGSVSGVQVGEVKGPTAALKMNLQRLQKDKSARQKVRMALLNRTGNLLDAINDAFSEIRLRLQTHKVAPGETLYSDFVILLDNLEKIENFDSQTAGEASQRALFIANSFKLTALRANSVYTVPLSLVRSEPVTLTQAYGDTPLVLPNVKSEHRGKDHLPYVEGRERLKEILQKRVPGRRPIEEIFESPALEFLIENSGGHIRNLLLFAREAVSYTSDRLPITLGATHQAIRKTVNVFQTSLKSADWTLLAELEASENQRWEATTPEKARLLEELAVLEYENGSREDEYNDPAPWAAVNPLIRRMNPFKAAQAVLIATEDPK